MVRTFKRKSNRGQYGLPKLLEAANLVKEGKISKRQAEKQFGIPRKTLTRHICGVVKNPGNLGRFGPVLGKEFEDLLVTF